MRFARMTRGISLVLWTSSAVAFAASPYSHLMWLAASGFSSDRIAEYKLSRLDAADYEAKAQDLISRGDLEAAAQVIDLGQKRGHVFEEELIQQAQGGILEGSFRSSKSFAVGFVTGEPIDAYALAGAVAADYLLVGDVRDVAIHGSAAAMGQEYDGLILALAVFGLATLAPGTGPLDAGASVMKTAARGVARTGGVMTQFKQVAIDAIDRRALREAFSKDAASSMLRAPSISKLTRLARALPSGATAKLDTVAWREAFADASPFDASGIKAAASKIIRKESIAEISRFTTSVGEIAAAGGGRVAIEAVKLSDDTVELARFAKVSRTFGDDTAAVLRLLGKSAIKLGELMWLLLTSAFALLGWAAWGGWMFFRILRGVSGVSLKKGVAG